jgi:hypothetical protein
MIDGLEVPINTDFRPCLRSILAFEDGELTTLEKHLVLLENLYPERPTNTRAAIEQAVKFLNGGKAAEEEDDFSVGRLYSFAQDDALIFAAFQQTHGIDLANTEYLHWWKFLALFMDLGSETTFSRLVGLRKRLKDGSATKEERRAAQKMTGLVDLPEPDTRSAEERDAEEAFLRLVAEGEKNRA